MTDSVKVNDSRMFNTDGSIKEDAEVAKQTAGANLAQDTANKTDALPPYPDTIDFSTFVLSLASSVQISLGVLPHPLTQKIEQDLRHAKQTIDILGMLAEKTTGNLNAEESGMMNHLLYQLRMQYVELTKEK